MSRKPGRDTPRRVQNLEYRHRRQAEGRCGWCPTITPRYYCTACALKRAAKRNAQRAQQRAQRKGIAA